MKTFFLTSVLLFISVAVFSSPFGTDERVLTEGSQPQIAVDAQHTIRIVYGQTDKVYCLESHDGGTTFSKPTLIADIPGMHLGMSRGPQLASSNHYSVVTAMDKSGTIHWYRLNNASGKWQNIGSLNDQPGSAPEGLMNIASDNNDHFYAVWLDIRIAKRNQIYFADLAPNAMKWSKNRPAYVSPDEHVCECCQPHIAVNGSEVTIMFRNWLNGSRDLYLLTSKNKGASFSPAQKLGNGTWKLNGCPMDGGGITANPASVATTWRREGTVYYCQPGQPEIAIGSGRNSSVTTSPSGTFIGYQANDTVRLVTLADKKTQAVGAGAFVKLATLPGKKVVCVWEHDDKIVFKSL